MANPEEGSFSKTVHKLDRLEAGEAFKRMMEVRWSEPALRWMKLAGIDKTELMNASWTLFVILEILSFSMLALLFLFLDDVAFYAFLPGILLPAAAAALLHNYPIRASIKEDNSMLRHSPSAIGCLSMSLQLQPSLERAVAFTVQREPNALGTRLKEALWSSMTRGDRDLHSNLTDFASSLSESNDGLKQAIHIVLSAAGERTREGMNRLLDKANAVALKGVTDSIERYASSLSVPAMVLFSMGVLLPVMLFTLIPLASLGSISSSEPMASVDPILVVLMIVVFPSASFLYARSILSRNPLTTVQPFHFPLDIHIALLLTAWLAILITCLLIAGEAGAYLFLLCLVCLPSALLFFKKRNSRSKRDSRVEKEFISSLYQIGNRMSAGKNLEESWLEAANTRQGSKFSDLSTYIIHKARMAGVPLDEIIRKEGCLKEIPSIVEGAYLTVSECAKRETSSAGKMALNFAQYLSDLRSCEEGIQEKLRSVIEMMRSTSLLFGPLVLGITTGLFALIVDGGSSLLDQIVLIIGVYLIELCFVVSYFTTFLSGARSWREVEHEFASRSPISVIIFIAVCIISNMGLTTLL